MNTYKDRQGIGNESPGSDDLPVGDIQYAAGLVDQDKSQRRQGIDGAHHDATDHQLKKITHATPSIV